MKLKMFKTLALSFIFFSCNVTLIGAYDQVTDLSIQKIQNDVSILIVKLERNVEDNNPVANSYENFKSSYENIEGEVESLIIRCGALEKYQLISRQVNLLQTNIKDFEKIHKLGLTTKQPIETIKRTFEIYFKSMIILQNGLKRKK